MDTVTPAYRPRDPSGTVLYQVISEYLEAFLASIEADTNAKGLPAYVQEEFYASVKQRIAYDERAGQQMRRIGAEFGDEGERQAIMDARCANVHGFSLHANV